MMRRLTSIGALAFAALLGACSSGGGSTPTFASPPGQGPVSVGGLPANIPYAGSAGSGYVAVPAGVSIPTGDGVNIVVQASPLPGIPTLQSVLRRPASLPAGSSVVLYYGITFSQTTTLSGGLAFQYIPPAGVNLGSGQWFIASYDPTASTPTWVAPLLGPGTVASQLNSLQFGGLPGALTLMGGRQYAFALYEILGGAITATPTSATIKIGATQSVTVAEANYSGTFTAASGNTAIATVSGAGPFTITGTGVGSTTVTMTDSNGHSVLIPVIVQANALSVAPTTTTINIGATQNVTVAEANYSGTFTAASGNTALATVSPASGAGPFTITGTGVGSTTVMISDSNGQTATVAVTVQPNALSVSPTTLAFTSAGQVQTATASELGYAGTYTAVSNATGIATVSVSGATISITAVAAGTTTITVTDTYGQSQTISVGVTTTGGIIQ